VIGFTDNFNMRLVTRLNYSAIANLHTLQISTANAKSFQSAVSSPAVPCFTASNSGDSPAAPTKSSLHRLPYNCQNQSHIATDGQSVKLGVDPQLGPMTYILLSDS
jgi:hypothetical protein